MKLLFRLLMPALFGDFLRLHFGGDSSSSSSSSTTNLSTATDNRQVLGDGAIGASSGGSVVLSSTDARTFSDSRDMSTNLAVNDSSNRSTTNSGNTTVTYQDPGALRAMEAALTNNRATTQSALDFARIASDNGAQAASDAARASAQTSQSLFSQANATLNSGFSSLLSLGKSMFDSNVAAVNNVGALTAQAYREATSEKSGTLDNKTITMLGLAAAAVVAVFAFRKG